MDDAHTSNAMTEIALALAMSFFSVMILAIVSMGAGSAEEATAEAPEMLAAKLAPSDGAAPAARHLAAEDDRIVVYHSGAFFDAELAPLDPASLSGGGRVVLALDPATPMAEALAARGRIDVADLVVATLDERWLAALKERRP